MINVFGSLVGDKELEQVKESIMSSWLGMGDKVEQFESDFSNWRNLDNFLMVDSGSNALFMAVSVLDLPKGSEVILPSFTWVSCAQAVILAGCRPVFCDVEYDTCNMTAEMIKPLITPRTSAIMVVHYAGLPVDMDPIMELGLPVIEDAAHAVCSHYKGKACGAIGDVGIFSFDAVKNLTAGEGGGIVFKSKDHYDRAKRMRYCGIGKSGFKQSQEEQGEKIWWEYEISEVFIKMLPNDINAGIALAQLGRIDSLQRRRDEVWSQYDERLSGVGDLELPVEAPDEMSHSRFTYVVKTDRRNELAHHLLERGIYSTLRYHPLHLNKLYGHAGSALTNTEILNQVALSIPMHPALTQAEVDTVVRTIAEFYTSP